MKPLGIRGTYHKVMTANGTALAEANATIKHLEEMLRQRQ